jgi:hypothetical protein
VAVRADPFQVERIYADAGGEEEAVFAARFWDG